MQYALPLIQNVLDSWLGYGPTFLWAPTSKAWLLKDRIKGVTAAVAGTGGAIQEGGIPRVIANSADSYISFPTNCGIGGGSSAFIGVMLVEIKDPAAVTGCFLKIGNVSGGLGFGAGNTTFENSGAKAIILREGVAWHVSDGTPLVRGLNVLVFGTETSTNIVSYVNINTGAGVASPEGSAVTNIAPSANVFINGYYTNRGANVRTLAAAIYQGQNYSNALAVVLGRSALVFKGFRGAQQLFAPSRRIDYADAIASAAPSITALSAISITATSAQPRISYS